jgi:hypothetical protein
MINGILNCRIRNSHGIIVIFMLMFVSCSKKPEPLPVLLIADQAEFGSYTGQILQTEGFNGYTARSFSDPGINLSYLGKYDAVVLSKQKINPAQAEMLKKYVSGGGILVAVRPDISLFDLCGISEIAGQLEEGYMSVDTTTPAGKGLATELIKLHSTSGLYNLTTGVRLAGLYDKEGKLTGNPALVSNSYGDGTAYTFSYNLPENVVFTRQGNPSSAGKEMDGINGLRAMDLFAGGWVDTSANTINPADLQMSLLSHCIETGQPAGKPFPRMWYFPDELKCLVTLTNDGEFRAEPDFEEQFSDMDSMGAKMTLYVLETGKISGNWSKKWTSKGFEISGHPDDTHEAGDPHWSNMVNALKTKKSEVADLYGTPMKTVVNHWFVWCGMDSSGNPEFSAQAMIEESQGLGLDINYAHYDNGSTGGHFLGTPGYGQGNYNGSGLVMKFATSNGRTLNIYQHLNNVYDQQYMEMKDPDGFFECFKGLMDRSLNKEVYSFISVKSHNDEYFFSKEPLRRMISYASGHGIPVWTASKLLDFLKTRDDAYFSELLRNGNTLSFKLNSSHHHDAGITFMVPLLYGSSRLKSITIDRKEYSFREKMFKGRQYGFITVKPGKNYTVTARYED